MRDLVCVICERSFRPKKVGITLIEMFDDPPRPYRLWNADLLECPKCGHAIVAKFGDRPKAEHHQPGFARALEIAERKTVIVREFEKER